MVALGLSKKQFLFGAAALLMIVISGKATPPIAMATEPPIVFAEPAIERAIRYNLLRASGDIYPSDVAGIEKLGVVSAGVTRLDDLRYCTELVELNLMGNLLEDISPLGHLENLSKLWLGYNQIKSIDALLHLTKLNELDLSRNPISGSF